MDPHSRVPKKNTSHGMRCYRKILHISYKNHVTYEKVRAKIQQAIGPHGDLLTIVKRLQTAVVWSCFRTVKGGRRQGGQRKRREDNIRQWTGIEFSKSQRALENREKWRKKTGWKIICGAPTTLAVKGLMMMMMTTVVQCTK